MDKTTLQAKEDKGRSDHRILTVNGHVRLSRRHYHSPAEGTCTPSDALLDCVEATVSMGAREMCSRVNADSRSFDRAAQTLKRTAQLSLSSDGFMVPLITNAEKVARREKVVQKRRRCGKKRKPLPPRKRGTDQRYKEFKAVMFYDQTMDHRLVSVTSGNCDEAGRVMRRDAGRIQFGQADDRVGNIDGGPWIIAQIQKRRLPMTATGLDFYHLGENVHKARRSLFGEEDAAGTKLAGDLLHTAKHQGYEPFWEKLLEMRKQCRGICKRKAADGLLHYVSERRAMIQYPLFLAHGWQIGSGPMESQCRVVPDRVKGPGKRWDMANAEAVMAFESLHQSDQWAHFWKAALDHDYQMN